MKIQTLFAGALLAALTACGSGTSTDTPATSTTATTTPAAATTTTTTATTQPTTDTTTTTPATTGNLPTYGPVVSVVGGVNYCKRPLTDDEWAAIKGNRAESERAALYRLSPCTS